MIKNNKNEAENMKNRSHTTQIYLGLDIHTKIVNIKCVSV